MFLRGTLWICSTKYISVLQAKFCWLGDVEVMICPWKENIAGKNTILGFLGYLMCGIAAVCYYLSETEIFPFPRPFNEEKNSHTHCSTETPPPPPARPTKV